MMGWRVATGGVSVRECRRSRCLRAENRAQLFVRIRELVEDAGYYVVVVGLGDLGAVEGAGD